VNFLIHEIRAILECPVSAVERSASRTNRFLEKTALLNRGSKPSVSNRVF
jgi:hypothetical protein